MAPEAVSSNSKDFVANVKTIRTPVTHPLDELTGDEVCIGHVPNCSRLSPESNAYLSVLMTHIIRSPWSCK